MRNGFGCPVHTLLDTTQHLAIRSVVSCHVDNDKKSQDSHGDTVKLRSLSSLPQGPLCRPCLQERFVAAISPCMVYFPTFEFGKYTGPMDPTSMGFQSPCLSARAMCIAMTGKTRTKGCHLPKCQSYPKLVSCSSKYLATKFVSKHMFQADSYYMLLSSTIISSSFWYRIYNHPEFNTGNIEWPSSYPASRFACFTNSGEKLCKVELLPAKKNI